MPGIEKAAGSAAHAIATYDPEPITTASLVASVKGEPAPATAKPAADAGTREIVKTVKGAEAAAAAGAAGKALGDGVAWQLCDPEATK